MRKIVGVHGVGNLRPKETAEEARRNLADVWHRNLKRGRAKDAPDEFAVSMAYYADLLVPSGAQGATVGGSLDALPEDAEQMVRDWLLELGLPAEQSQGPGTWPIRQALGWLAERRRIGPKLTEAFVARFFGEVAAYLRPGTAREDARSEVARVIREQRPEVLIAHSLGSVVAYEALWHEPRPEVPLLITLGSPLALPHAVFPRLQPSPGTETGTGGRPPGVRRWVNIADPGDLVALPVRGVSRRFERVDSDLHDVVDAFDFHRAANYLACSRLATVLKETGPLS
ncbi:alpha/beta hydrolase family protein [Streptomyces mirabilis]|uniref:serine peptidase n=1 Tax=Streptomyces mirabilis TaxID=68239 RepID=UPI00332D8F32